MINFPSTWQPVVVGVLAYGAGRRAADFRQADADQMERLHLVVTIALGSVLATTMTSSTVSLAQGVVSLMVLTALHGR